MNGDLMVEAIPTGILNNLVKELHENADEPLTHTLIDAATKEVAFVAGYQRALEDLTERLNDLANSGAL